MLRRAAADGDAEAEFRLGDFHVEKDQEQALRWYRKAALHGHTKAQLVLDAARSAPVPPRAIDGAYDASKFLRYVAELTRRKLAADERALTCYELDKANFDTEFARVVDTCSAMMLSNFPDVVRESAAIEFSRQFGACVRDENIKQRGIDADALGRCLRKL